jgi:hypothetical protein
MPGFELASQRNTKGIGADVIARFWNNYEPFDPSMMVHETLLERKDIETKAKLPKTKAIKKV